MVLNTWYCVNSDHGNSVHHVGMPNAVSLASSASSIAHSFQADNYMATYDHGQMLLHILIYVESPKSGYIACVLPVVCSGAVVAYKGDVLSIMAELGRNLYHTDTSLMDLYRTKLLAALGLQATIVWPDKEMTCCTSVPPAARQVLQR